MLKAMARLDSVISPLSPTVSLTILTETPPSIRIDFDVTATGSQKTAAQNALASFDWSDAAQTSWEANRIPERAAIRNALAQLAADCNAYSAISVPTLLQMDAFLKKVAVWVPKVVQRLSQID